MAQEELSPPPKSQPASDEFPIDGFSPGKLKDHFGVGATSINEVSPAISVRYWFDNTQALDVSFGGYQTDPTDWNMGIGVALKTNQARPTEDVYFQWMYKAEFSRVPSLSVPALETDKLSFFVGPGFEAFIPFWKNLSVEAFIGGIMTLQLYPSTSNNPMFAIGGDNFSIFNAAVHFYFDN